MKSFIRSLLLALAFATGAGTPVQAQTLDQSIVALNRKDYKTAFAGFTRLAEQGNVTLQFELGVMYGYGKGVPKDDQLAVAWYRKAAEQGLAIAQLNLGLMFADGNGVPEDDQLAVAWFRKAADQGFAAAQSNLGFMLAKGQGVPKDDQSAYFWLLLSSAQGNSNAVKNRDIVEKNLTPQQRANAQAAARVWSPK